MSMPERIMPRPMNIARAAPTEKYVTMETTKATHAAAAVWGSRIRACLLHS